MSCPSSGSVRLGAPGTLEKQVEVFVVEKKVLGFDFILGMNGIVALDGVVIVGSGDVRLGVQACTAAGSQEHVERRDKHGKLRVEESGKALCVKEEDFTVSYDPGQKRWMAEWRWSENEPGVLKGSVNEYKMSNEYRREYEEELKRWVDEGWPYDVSEMGDPVGLIPLMAVVQKKKGKVRPVMDYRSLNEHVDTYTANADVCIDKVREWRKTGVNVCALELKGAYLQIDVNKSLWRFQTVMVRGRVAR